MPKVVDGLLLRELDFLVDYDYQRAEAGRGYLEGEWSRLQAGALSQN